MWVTWRKEDVFTFQINKVKGVIFTRRGLPTKIAGMFDPLGLASPATVKGKIGQQKLTIAHTLPQEQQILRGSPHSSGNIRIPPFMPYLPTPNPIQIANNNTIAIIIAVSVRRLPNILNLVDIQHRETIPPTATRGCGWGLTIPPRPLTLRKPFVGT